MEALIVRYHRIRDELRDRHPSIWAEVAELSRNVAPVICLGQGA
jgi:hypothetical protein